MNVSLGLIFIITLSFAGGCICGILSYKERLQEHVTELLEEEVHNLLGKLISITPKGKNDETKKP